MLTISVAPFGRSPTLTLSAAGFIATRTFGWSPGVRMSWSAKCTWNPDAREGARGGADLRREVRERHEVVPEDRGLAREPVAGQLHAVAGVAGEADDDPLELLDGLRLGHGRGIAHAEAARTGAMRPAEPATHEAGIDVACPESAREHAGRPLPGISACTTSPRSPRRSRAGQDRAALRLRRCDPRGLRRAQPHRVPLEPRRAPPPSAGWIAAARGTVVRARIGRLVTRFI